MRCQNGCLTWTGLPLGQSWYQSNPRLCLTSPAPTRTWLVLFPTTMPILNCSSLHPSGELPCRAREPGAGAQLLLRWMLSGHTKLARVPGSFNSFLYLVSGLSKRVPARHKSCLGFLLLLCQSHWFSNQLRRLDFLVLDHKAGVPHLWFKLLTPLVESVDPGIPPPLCHLLGTQVLTWFFLFLSYPTLCLWMFLTILVVEDSFCQCPVCFQWELLYM